MLWINFQLPIPQCYFVIYYKILITLYFCSFLTFVFCSVSFINYFIVKFTVEFLCAVFKDHYCTWYLFLTRNILARDTIYWVQPMYLANFIRRKNIQAFAHVFLFFYIQIRCQDLHLSYRVYSSLDPTILFSKVVIFWLRLLWNNLYVFNFAKK